MTQKEQIKYLARALLHLSKNGSLTDAMRSGLVNMSLGIISGDDLMKKKFPPAKRR